MSDLEKLSDIELTTGAWKSVEYMSNATGRSQAELKNWARTGRITAKTHKGQIVIYLYSHIPAR